jgi:hypothetical protein
VSLWALRLQQLSLRFWMKHFLMIEQHRFIYRNKRKIVYLNEIDNGFD